MADGRWPLPRVGHVPLRGCVRGLLPHRYASLLRPRGSMWAEHSTAHMRPRCLWLQGTSDSTAACCRVPSSSGRRAWSTSCSSTPRSAHPFGLPSRPRYPPLPLPPFLRAKCGPHRWRSLTRNTPQEQAIAQVLQIISSQPHNAQVRPPIRLSWLLEGGPGQLMRAEPPPLLLLASFARCISNARCWARKTCWSPWQKSSRPRYAHDMTRHTRHTPQGA